MRPVKPPYTRRQLLVCTHHRDPATGKSSCGVNGSGPFRELLKKTVKERGLKGTVVVTQTGCLDICPTAGCAIAYHPDGEFFVSDTTPEAADAAIAHLLREG